MEPVEWWGKQYALLWAACVCKYSCVVLISTKFTVSARQPVEHGPKLTQISSGQWETSHCSVLIHSFIHSFKHFVKRTMSRMSNQRRWRQSALQCDDINLCEQCFF